MLQSKLSSFLEALMNIAIGYGIAVASQIMIFPIFNIHIAIITNFYIGIWFTAISLIRSYIIRRWFNTKLHAAALKLAGDKK